MRVPRVNYPEKECFICGRFFKPMKSNSKCCSIECQKVKNQMRSRYSVENLNRKIIELRKLHGTFNNVNGDANKASELGMSYGKLKAFEYIEKQRSEQNGN